MCRACWEDQIERIINAATALLEKIQLVAIIDPIIDKELGPYITELEGVLMADAYTDAHKFKKEPRVSQIDLLADYIMSEIPGEPSQDEGAGDCAVRLLKKYRRALEAIMQNLGEPGPEYFANVVHAYNVAKNTLDND
jgi:hypothetical protein